MSEAPAIVVKDLHVSYGKTEVISGVDFQLGANEFTAIVGQSGTGKSTFLGALAGLIDYKGEVNSPSELGYVFQNFAVFPWMNVRENIKFGLDGETDGNDDRVDELLQRIGMVELAHRYPAQLSGGQIQRIALARALAGKPRVILMDEPYGALDHHTRERMQDWLLNQWEITRCAVVFVTHYIEEAIFLADRVLVLRNGKFVKEFSPPFGRPRSPEDRLSPELVKFKSLILRELK